MSCQAFILIICSAFFHVSWNLLAKKGRITLAFYTLMEVTAVLCWSHVFFWTPISIWQIPRQAWLCIIGAVAFDTLYGFGIERAYANLEMSIAYPMMRSLPLLATAALTTIFGWGAPLTWKAMAGMVVVFCGCLIIPLARFGDLSWKRYCNRGFMYVLTVAAGTTGYTIFDKQAQVHFSRAFPDASTLSVSVTYYVIRILLLIVALLLIDASTANRRHQVRALFGSGRWRMAIGAGFGGGLTYTTVLASMNYVTNVAYVQVFRQLGLVLGMVGGIVFLHEKATWPKFVGVAFIFIGLILTVL